MEKRNKIHKETPTSESRVGLAETDLEIIPERFPIVEDARRYYGNDLPESLVEGRITHYLSRSLFGDKERHRFRLSKIIAGLHYVFTLDAGSWGDYYSLSFKTSEYEYAVVELDKDSRSELFSALIGFIEAVSEYPDIDLKEIHIFPADVAYSRQEIERCIDEIMASPKNKLSREEILKEYTGYNVFDLYQQIYDTKFDLARHSARGRALARSRLFKSLFKKHLVGWKVEEEPFDSSDFSLLRRRETS